MSVPNPNEYFGDVDDESGPILPPWYTVGWTSQNKAYLPAPSNPFAAAQYPNDQKFVVLNQNYFDGDANPLGGFLTFWPSSAITITENNTSLRVPQRLAGTNTWPFANAGISPWAFSLEGSGKIYIFRGLFVVKLYATDNPNMVTDNGKPLTYHVIEHFLGGQEYDISVPGSTPAGSSIYPSLIVPGSAQPWQYDPVFPAGIPDLPQVPESDEFIITQEVLSTDWAQFSIAAGSDPTGYSVGLAFTAPGVQPTSDGQFHAAGWLHSGYPYVAQILIGPGGGALPLAQGTYDVTIKIYGSPEQPVFKVGQMVIT